MVIFYTMKMIKSCTMPSFCRTYCDKILLMNMATNAIISKDHRVQVIELFVYLFVCLF